MLDYVMQNLIPAFPKGFTGIRKPPPKLKPPEEPPKKQIHVPY